MAWRKVGKAEFIRRMIDDAKQRAKDLNTVIPAYIREKRVKIEKRRRFWK